MTAMLLTGCGKKPISFEEALAMEPDKLDKAVVGMRLSDLEDVWGEFEGENINGVAFSKGDEAIIVYADPKGVVDGIRRCSWCEGRFVSGRSGDNIVLIERSGYTEPAVVSTAEFVDFEGIENGDRVKILVDGIDETYPCQTVAYGVRLIEKGSYDDLDEDAMESLKEMGWVD